MSPVMRGMAVMIAVLLMSACGSDDDGAATPQRETTPSPSPPIESIPKAESKEFPTTICCRGDRIRPGRYAVPYYVIPPLVVSVPKGWRVINEQSGRLFALVQGTNDIGQASRWLTVLPAGEVAQKDVERSLLDMKELDFQGKGTAVRVLGRPATRLDAVALPNPSEEGSPGAGIAPGTQRLSALNAFVAPGFAMTTSSAEARLRFFVVGGKAGVLVLHLEAPPNEFNDFIGQANRVLETLEQ